MHPFWLTHDITQKRATTYYIDLD